MATVIAPATDTGMSVTDTSLHRKLILLCQGLGAIVVPRFLDILAEMSEIKFIPRGCPTCQRLKKLRQGRKIGFCRCHRGESGSSRFLACIGTVSVAGTLDFRKRLVLASASALKLAEAGLDVVDNSCRICMDEVRLRDWARSDSVILGASCN